MAVLQSTLFCEILLVASNSTAVYGLGPLERKCDSPINSKHLNKHVGYNYEETFTNELQLIFFKRKFFIEVRN